jgi:hypothetical protein
VYAVLSLDHWTDLLLVGVRASTAMARCSCSSFILITNNTAACELLVMRSDVLLLVVRSPRREAHLSGMVASGPQAFGAGQRCCPQFVEFIEPYSPRS